MEDASTIDTAMLMIPCLMNVKIIISITCIWLEAPGVRVSCIAVRHSAYFYTTKICFPDCESHG